MISLPDSDTAITKLKHHIVDVLAKHYPKGKFDVVMKFHVGGFRLVGRSLEIKLRDAYIVIEREDLMVAMGDFVTAYHDDPEMLEDVAHGVAEVLEELFGDQEE